MSLRLRCCTFNKGGESGCQAAFRKATEASAETEAVEALLAGEAADGAEEELVFEEEKEVTVEADAGLADQGGGC